MRRLLILLVAMGAFFTGALPASAAIKVKSEEYLDLVARKNPELAAAAARVEAHFRLVEVVTGGTRPQVALEASSGRVLREEFGESTLSLGVGKRLDLWGLDGLAIRQAELSARIQEARLAEFGASLLREAETAYWNAAAGKSAVSLYSSLLSQREEDLRVSRVRFNQGTAAKLDVFRAEVQVEKARAGKTEAEALLRDALSLMARLAGGEPVEPSDMPVPFEMDLVADLDAAWMARPDVRRVAFERAAAGVASRIASLGMVPTVDALLASTLLSDSDTVVPPESDILVSVKVEWPLYDGGRTRADKASKLLLEKASELDEKTLRTAVASELELASSRFEKARALEASRRKEAELASEELRITRLRYRAGLGSQLELLDAQVREQVARTEHLNALREMSVSRAQLRYALGLYVLPPEMGNTR